MLQQMMCLVLRGFFSGCLADWTFDATGNQAINNNALQYLAYGGDMY